MATQTVTQPVFGASGHADKKNVPYYASVVIDFALTSHTSTDVFEAMSVPAGTMILAAGMEKLVADAAGNSNQMALDDGTTTWVDAAVTTGTGQMTGLDAIGELWNHVTAAGHTLDVTLSVGEADGTIRVWAVLLDTSDPITEQRVTFA